MWMRVASRFREQQGYLDNKVVTLSSLLQLVIQVTQKLLCGDITAESRVVRVFYDV